MNEYGVDLRLGFGGQVVSVANGHTARIARNKPRKVMCVAIRRWQSGLFRDNPQSPMDEGQ